MSRKSESYTINDEREETSAKKLIWKTLTHNALEEEKRALALQAQPALQDLLDRKKALQKEKDGGQDALTRWLLLGGLAQALGLLLIALSETLSKLGK